MKPPLTLADIEAGRRTPGRAALLFITDRCPVGCDHCSVDSRKDSPMIEDWPLFHAVLEALASKHALEIVGISGGEPFVERRGLCEAVERLTAAGRHVVLYTSGIWALSKIPAWIPRVLAKASAVFLSTDAFHSAAISREALRHAAEVILGQGCQLVIQVLDEPGSLELARSLRQELALAFEESRVELNIVPPLPYGRGTHTLAAALRVREARSFGRCGALAAPVIRYDGKVIACCNEQLIMGLGPASLRRRCASAQEVGATLQEFSVDPALQVLRLAGIGALLEHPRLQGLQARKCRSLCEACWVVQDQISDRSDRLLSLMAEVVK